MTKLTIISLKDRNYAETMYAQYVQYIYVQESFHLQSALKACGTYLEILSRDMYLRGWLVCADR